MATALFVFAYAWYGLVTAPGAVPGALAAGWVSAWIWTLGFSPVMTFGLLLYPDGRLPSRAGGRRRPSPGSRSPASLIATAFAPGPLVNHPVADNPLGIPGTRGVLEVVGAAAEPLVLVGFAAGVAALVVRWRRAPAGGVERRQISLLALASGLALAVVLVPVRQRRIRRGRSRRRSWPSFALRAGGDRRRDPAPPPLRHRRRPQPVAGLRRADRRGGRAVRRAGVGGWPARSGPGRPPSLLATGVAAAAVLPLRTRLQRVVDRAMYGERGDPYAAVSRLTTRLQAAAAPGESLAAVAEAIAVSLRLPYVAVETAGGARRPTARRRARTGTSWSSATRGTTSAGW